MCIPHWFLCILQVTEALMASFQRFGTWEVSASHLGKEPFAKSWKKSFLPKKLKAGLVDLVKDRSDIFAIALPNETYICCPPSAHPSISFKWVCLWKRWTLKSCKQEGPTKCCMWFLRFHLQPGELNPGEAGGYLSDSCLTVIPRNAKIWQVDYVDSSKKLERFSLRPSQRSKWSPSMQLRMNIPLLPVREKIKINQHFLETLHIKLRSSRGSKVDIVCICLYICSLTF